MTPGAAHIPPVTSGPYPVREGNFVCPLVDGEPAFRRICEAVESAEHSAWVTVAFVDHEAQMPDGRGSFFDVLDAAQKRGIEVRALFWRADRERFPLSDTFWGDEKERAWLAKRGSRFMARWDHNPGYCHHQKSWLIDAGQPGETAFVGGINLHDNSIVPSGHPYLEHKRGSTHDVYVELRGPVATDVHHNFVQRWNGASECGTDHGYWPEACPDDLEYPSTLSAAVGEGPVQLTRTVRAGAYVDGTPPPGGEPHPIADGDGSMLDQYLAAIDAAQEWIYFENQAIGSPPVVARIEEALKRGVEVTYLAPGRPPLEMTAARKNPGTAGFFEQLAGLGKYPNFLLAGIAGNIRAGEYHDIYVHAKIALIDDAWATIGSTNVANRSFYRDTELNASFWHAETVRALRVELLREHLGAETGALDGQEAARLYREIAQENTARRRGGAPMSALAHSLDPASYGS